MKRGNVWLGVAALVVDEEGRILVVKKQYGGLKGKWSLPAGFVDPTETIDEAVKREVLEETGIECEVDGVIGIRSGVIKDEISDNMIIFNCKPLHTNVTVEEKELMDASFLTVEALKNDPATSLLIHHFIDNRINYSLHMDETKDPGKQFGYTSYRLFF
ncbi:MULTISPECIES: NUDIX domain-containing protein [Sutcliffiella]|uniref:NUDIX hydrolase n=1 Tax=Sutcliffiella cohnii TaxID=33932 RepID=A0A223KUG2_9BACI|nr:MULTISPECIES: NUDIX hydrolase [Sutcliffiella]AST93125.1 NUDIX hydrolase [Sutcliffiella cohnii]WBL14331.1 NUDIX hydrolase [Sutcliffiella sp. NC1]